MLGAVDGRENVVGVVRLLRRGAGGGDGGGGKPMDGDRPSGTPGARKASKSKSTKGSGLTKEFSTGYADGKLWVMGG